MNTTNEQLENEIYEFIRIKAQLKLLADRRADLLKQLEEIEKECIKEEKNFDQLFYK